MSFARSWLAAYVLVASWPLGSLALLLIHPLTGGRWGTALRPALLFGLCAMPVVALGVLPLLPGLHALYPWLRDTGFYLNGPAFAVRGTVYLLVWFGLAGAVLAGVAERVAAPGLFALALTVTFAAIDATLSLAPHFVSSIYGMIAGCGAVLLALAVAVALTAPRLASVVRDDAGKLLLALTILWTYLDFMQVLIVWQSDLAHDASWYLPRATGVWGVVGVAVVATHSVLPTAMLLSPRLRRSAGGLRAVAGVLIAAAVLRSWWTVLPPYGPVLLPIPCLAVAVIVAVGCSRVLYGRVTARVQHV